MAHSLVAGGDQSTTQPPTATRGDRASNMAASSSATARAPNVATMPAIAARRPDPRGVGVRFGASTVAVTIGLRSSRGRGSLRPGTAPMGPRSPPRLLELGLDRAGMAAHAGRADEGPAAGAVVLDHPAERDLGGGVDGVARAVVAGGAGAGLRPARRARDHDPQATTCCRLAAGGPGPSMLRFVAALPWPRQPAPS